MAIKLGKFQALGFEGWKGTASDNHIKAGFERHCGPQMLQNVMIQVLATKNGPALEAYLNQFPVKSFDTAEEYTWDVIGSSRKNVPLVEARTAAGDTVKATDEKVGANMEPFFLVFPEDYFADGETITGELNELYPVKIKGNAVMEGTNAVYCVECTGANTDGIPGKRLLAGERFSVEAAYVEQELSRKVGDVRFATPVSMRNEFSTVRIQHKVAGNKLNKKVCMGIPFIDNNGNKQVKNYWMHYVDFKVEEQFSEYKNNALMYGKSNRNDNGEYLNIGKSGNVIKQGAGLLEQMSVGNTQYYSDFSLKMLTNALYDLSEAKLDFGDRTFIVHTGSRGMALVNEAIKKETAGWTDINTTDVGAIKKTSSNVHSNSLAFVGGQFTEFYAPNGVVVKFVLDSLYDDPVRNKIAHPLGGPASSYRFDILYVGSMEQPNIQRCVVNGEPERRGYQWGPFRNPFTGATDNQYASYDEDSAVIHKMATLGICVLDPTRTMSFIPSVLLGEE